MVVIEKLTEAYIRIHTEEKSIKKEIDDFFSFRRPGFIVSKNQWQWLKKRDMKEPLFRERDSTLPLGLMPKLTEWLRHNKYEYRIEGEFGSKNFSEIEALEFIKTLNIPEKFTIRDYQLKYFVKCVRNQRAVVISPTNSGKSLLMYLIFRYYNQKMLITVPITNLIYQMYEDFKDYGYDVENNIHLLIPGAEKKSDKILTIGCWQSIYKQKKDFFHDFHGILGDECLSENSLIKMGDNSEKKISEICVGDMVKSLNETTHDIENKPVIKVYKNISVKEKMFEIELEDGIILQATGNHKFFQNGEWKRLDELKKGDLINTYS